MGREKNSNSAEQLLEEAKTKIVELEKALENCRQECTFERANNGAFLVAFLDSDFKEQAAENDLKASQAKEPAAPTAAANAWRKASEMLREFAVAEFPAAQKTLAAIDGTDRPPLRSHLLLIAVLMKLLGETSGITRGLQSEILGKISEMKWSVLGLRKTNIERMLAAANKAASHHDLR